MTVFASVGILVLSIVLANEPGSRPEDRPVPSPEKALDSFVLPDGYDINCLK